MSKLKMGNYYLDKKSIFTILKTNKDTKKKKIYSIFYYSSSLRSSVESSSASVTLLGFAGS